MKGIISDMHVWTQLGHKTGFLGHSGLYVIDSYRTQLAYLVDSNWTQLVSNLDTASLDTTTPLCNRGLCQRPSTQTSSLIRLLRSRQ